MARITKFLLLLLVPLVFSGCSTTLTNLTSSRQIRNAGGVYPIEVAWSSRDETIIKDTIKPCVMVGMDCIEMKRTSMMKNRWEALVPVPKGQNVLNYQFRFDYEYKTFSGPQPNSILSGAHSLSIIDR